MLRVLLALAPVPVLAVVVVQGLRPATRVTVALVVLPVVEVEVAVASRLASRLATAAQVAVAKSG